VIWHRSSLDPGWRTRRHIEANGSLALAGSPVALGTGALWVDGDTAVEVYLDTRLEVWLSDGPVANILTGPRAPGTPTEEPSE